MKHFNLFLLFSIVLFCGASIFGQNAPPPEGTPPQARPEGDRRPNLLAALGLKQDQIRQIRIINRDRKPQLMEAQKRLREANRALDMAIYADAVNDKDVQAGLKEFNAAQAEVAAIRFTTELAVRKVLTDEQIVRFRELRRKFTETRREAQKPPVPNGDQPARPIERFRRRLPNN